MNNKTNNQNRTLLDQNRSNTQDMYNSFLPGMQKNYQDASANDISLRNSIADRYANSNNFMPEGMTTNDKGWFNLPDYGGGGGSVGADYSAAKSGYQKLADTGGINRGDFSQAQNAFTGFLSNGGLDQNAQDNMRYRATSMVPSFYQNYKNEAARKANVQGGYSPGYDAQQAQIGRDASAAGYDASRKAEADISQQVQQGRMFGASGSAGLASTMNSLEQGGKIAGLGGLKGIGDSELSASSTNAGLAESKASRNQQLQLALQDMYQKGKMGSAQGLQSLYSSAPGATGQAGSMFLQGTQGLNSAQLQNLMARSSIQNKGIDWSKLFGAAGSVAGMFGGGGFGGYDSKSQALQNDLYALPWSNDK